MLVMVVACFPMISLPFERYLEVPARAAVETPFVHQTRRDRHISAPFTQNQTIFLRRVVTTIEINHSEKTAFPEGQDFRLSPDVAM